MEILIDTHIFLWLLSNPERIDKRRLELLEDYTNDVYLSSVSIAELMIKTSIGTVNINFNPVEEAERSGLEVIAFDGNEALLLRELPSFHKDPFDRMLICQALHNNYYMMTEDEKFHAYSCRLI